MYCTGILDLLRNTGSGTSVVGVVAQKGILGLVIAVGILLTNHNLSNSIDGINILSDTLAKKVFFVLTCEGSILLGLRRLS